MMRIGLKFSLVCALVLASLGAPWLKEPRAPGSGRERAASLRLLDAQLAESRAENARLSNLLAHTGSALSADQFHELLRLRGEIARLRENAREAARLQAANPPRPGASAGPEPRAESPPPAAESVLAHWPKARLSPVGHGDPIAGLQTALWALNRNDPGGLAAALAPNTLSQLVGRYPGDSPAEQMATGTQWVSDSLAPASGFYVVDQMSLSDDQALLDVYFETEGAAHRVMMLKTEDEWKFGAMVTRNEAQPRRFSILWP